MNPAYYHGPPHACVAPSSRSNQVAPSGERTSRSCPQLGDSMASSTLPTGQTATTYLRFKVLDKCDGDGIHFLDFMTFISVRRIRN
mmetsp:Transcript_21742/g.45921  ORF Transcript_21742/g.45921 Transcript_21742/m.45921 type:complete len:86 (+) Transcript_21742:720-977(+)